MRAWPVELYRKRWLTVVRAGDFQLGVVVNRVNRRDRERQRLVAIIVERGAEACLI